MKKKSNVMITPNIRARLPNDLKLRLRLAKSKTTHIIAIIIVSVYLLSVLLISIRGEINSLNELRIAVYIIIGYYFARGIENGND